MVQSSHYQKQDWGIWTNVSIAFWLLLTSDKLLQEGIHACLRFFQLF
jgi:hypothetical protein